jgi:hypothetical protein
MALRLFCEGGLPVAITSIEEIRAANAAQEIELSGWEPGVPFRCKARRPRLFEMAAAGEIPNPLLPVVEELFMQNSAALGKRSVADQSKALIALADMTLVEPTAAEIHEAGAVLTDDQLLEIYTFVLGGAAALAGFREAARRATSGNAQANERKAKRTTAGG